MELIMSIIVNGTEYKLDIEVRDIIGISVPTFYNWITKGIIKPPDRRNHRGWRLWLQSEIDEILKFKNGTFNSKDELIQKSIEKNNHEGN
jgi:predicted DNA-binding transcriptional regulator AlpA